MSRGPRPHKVLEEAVPIAKARGLVQVTLCGPELSVNTMPPSRGNILNASGAHESVYYATIISPTPGPIGTRRRTGT